LINGRLVENSGALVKVIQLGISAVGTGLKVEKKAVGTKSAPISPYPQSPHLFQAFPNEAITSFPLITKLESHLLIQSIFQSCPVDTFLSASNWGKLLKVVHLGISADDKGQNCCNKKSFKRGRSSSYLSLFRPSTEKTCFPSFAVLASHFHYLESRKTSSSYEAFIKAELLVIIFLRLAESLF